MKNPPRQCNAHRPAFRAGAGGSVERCPLSILLAAACVAALPYVALVAGEATDWLLGGVASAGFGGWLVWARAGRRVRRFAKLCRRAARRAAARIARLGTGRDRVSGLLTRRGFKRSIADALARDRARKHVLLYIDLDRFARVNEEGGRVAGDRFLAQLSELLRTRVRASDVLGRMGGDEFAVLLRACPIEQALRIANDIRLEIGNFRLVRQRIAYRVTASVGLVVINPGDVRSGAIQERAQAACAAAKEAGRDQVRVHAPAGSRNAEMHLAESVHEAIEDNRFRLLRQRIADLHSAETHHYELLLRMVDRQGRIIPPTAFIPAAERHNMMQAVDRWVIRHAFPGIKREYDAASGNKPMFAINLSAASINDSRFAEFVRDQLALNGVPGEAVCFEITETQAVANLHKASALIMDLKTLGLRFALDDFGAGMSSFAYLKHLPVDYLKIDGAFVRDLHGDPVNAEIVSSVSKIAHTLGIPAVAEFVENLDTLVQLKDMGVDFAQGHAVGRPFHFA